MSYKKRQFLLSGSSRRKVGQAGPDMAAGFTVHCVDARSPAGSSSGVSTKRGEQR